jgi:hypothetical protein
MWYVECFRAFFFQIHTNFKLCKHRIVECIVGWYLTCFFLCVSYYVLVRSFQTDAGCNCVMKYEDLNIVDGTPVAKPTSVFVLPQYTALPALPLEGPCAGVTPPMGPPFCGQYQDSNGDWLYDVEAVPTSLRTRPGVKGKVYISTLVGAIWNFPTAQIVEVGVNRNGDFIDGTMQVVADDFNAIGDFAFYGKNKLMVLELNPGTPTISFSGRLTQVNLKTGDKTILAEKELVSPAGIAIDGDMLYITNNTYIPGQGPTDLQCKGHVIMANLKSAKTSKSSKRARLQ